MSSAPPPPPPLHGGAPGYPPASPIPGAPPGYTPYNTNPVAAYAKKIGGLAKALQILMFCYIAAALLTLVVTIGERGTLRDFLDGTISEDEAKDSIAKIGLPSSLAGLTQLAIVVLTMIWMFRLAKNHRLLGRTNSTWAPGWAIGGWFLPPFLFVIPFLMFRELWKGSDPSSPPNDPSWKSKPVGGIVLVWWLLYGVAGIVVAGVQFSSFGRTGNIEDAADFYDTAIGLSAVSSAISIAAALSYVVLVKQLTARQRALVGEQ